MERGIVADCLEILGKALISMGKRIAGEKNERLDEVKEAPPRVEAVVRTRKSRASKRPLRGAAAKTEEGQALKKPAPMPSDDSRTEESLTLKRTAPMPSAKAEERKGPKKTVLSEADRKKKRVQEEYRLCKLSPFGVFRHERHEAASPPIHKANWIHFDLCVYSEWSELKNKKKYKEIADMWYKDPHQKKFPIRRLSSYNAYSIFTSVTLKNKPGISFAEIGKLWKETPGKEKYKQMCENYNKIISLVEYVPEANTSR
ncbi:MAG: uncharacterized protein A8A55_0382 [Amphiamblys sp. WSBS2006]|nr:MAG: uncharacterized protein A8A55_0382 [Amphiamblys sp. WSBS2006]